MKHLSLLPFLLPLAISPSLNTAPFAEPLLPEGKRSFLIFCSFCFFIFSIFFSDVSQERLLLDSAPSGPF
jgi:hypothetical protein